MKILVAGSHGMIGSVVTCHLIEYGHEVVRLVRSTPGPGEVWWDPDAGKIDASGVEGFDGVVNLATMRWPFRWTRKAKEKIRANRIATYRLLAGALAACVRKPRVLVCASGIGLYPSSGDEIITEDTVPCSKLPIRRGSGWGDGRCSGGGGRHPRRASANPAGDGWPSFTICGFSGRGGPAVDQLGRTRRAGFHNRVCPDDRDFEWTGQCCQSPPAA